MPKTKTKPQLGVMDYDPNIRWANQTIKVTLGTWRYRATREIVINGNCKGMAVLDEHAVVPGVLAIILKECGYPEDLTDCDEVNEHYDGTNRLGFEMKYETKTEIRTLWCEPDQDDLESWIAGHIIGVEIIAIKPEKP